MKPPYKCVSCKVEYEQEPCYLAPNGRCEKCKQKEMACGACDEDEQKDCDISKLVYAPCKYCTMNIKTTCINCKLHCCTASMLWIYPDRQNDSWRDRYPYWHHIRTKLLCSDCVWLFRDYGFDVIRRHSRDNVLPKFRLTYALETYNVLSKILKKYKMYDRLFIKSLALYISKL